MSTVYNDTSEPVNTPDTDYLIHIPSISLNVRSCFHYFIRIVYFSVIIFSFILSLYYNFQLSHSVSKLLTQSNQTEQHLHQLCLLITSDPAHCSHV